MTPGSITLEICVDEPTSVAAAIAGGADRLELCAALPLGGLTPSLGFVRIARAMNAGNGVELYAMVRPRAGDFAYDARELTQAIDESLTLIDAGVDGLVFGAARHGELDRSTMDRWLGAVRQRRPDIGVTFHRAIDTLLDPVGAVALAADMGIDRILTSGGATTAASGTDTIARMREAAADRIDVMTGGGVRADNVAALLEATDVTNVHASASGEPVAVDPAVAALRFATPVRRPTSEAIVRALRNRIDAYSARATGESDP